MAHDAIAGPIHSEAAALLGPLPEDALRIVATGALQWSGARRLIADCDRADLVAGQRKAAAFHIAQRRGELVAGRDRSHRAIIYLCADDRRARHIAD